MGSSPTATGLHQVKIRVHRFSDGDTLDFLINSVGLECDSVAATFDFAPGTMAEAMIQSSDLAGNWSCIGSHVVFAIPAQDVTPGLQTVLFDQPNFTAFVATRTDFTIDHDWDFDPPHPGMGADQFSIQWLGYLTPAVSGLYQFHARVEDGCRVKVGPTLVIDDWAVQEEHERTGSVVLQGGTRYDLSVEYLAWNGDAMMRLSWTPPGGTKQVIPAEAFSQ